MCEFYIVDVLELYFTKNQMNLVKKWCCRNIFTDLSNTKISKNHDIKGFIFQIHPNKLHSKYVNNLFATNLKRNLEF
jgi:hypothetical protein